MNSFQAYSHYYEALYKDKNYEEEAIYVINLIRSITPKAIRLLELGCGTGKHAEFFCLNGFSVLGLDQSENSISIAKEKKITHFQAMVSDISSYQLDEKFDVAISLFHVLSYLTTNEKLISCFLTTYRHLERGGLFLFDIWYTPAVYHQQPETRIKRIKIDKLSITRLAEPVIEYNTNVVKVHYEVIVKDHTSGQTDSIIEQHSMRHFSWPEIELLASQTGFSVIHAEEFGTGKTPGKETWGVCFILQKN
jgi:SAM-dependent methyltransferase